MKIQATESKQGEINQVEKSQADAQVESFQTEVAEMAYYKSESRGFAPGFELEDWLEAELVCKSA